MSENEIRVLYVQPGKYPEERTIPNTLRALQELVGGDIECCRPWRDSVCVICNDSGKIDGLPPNRLYGHTDFLACSSCIAYGMESRWRSERTVCPWRICGDRYEMG